MSKNPFQRPKVGPKAGPRIVPNQDKNKVIVTTTDQMKKLMKEWNLSEGIYTDK